MKISFIYQKITPFIKKDIEIVGSEYDVTPFEFKGLRDVFGLFINILQSSFVYIWFGKLHAFFGVLFSKMLGKRAAVVAGGDDVSAQTQTGKPYGVFSSFWKGWMVRWLFKHADLVITVSGFAQAELIKNAGINSDKLSLIYHGFDDEMFVRNTKAKKKIVVTIGTIWEEDYFRKGYNHFIECAKRMPDFIFYLVGPQRDNYFEKQVKVPSNVRVLDKGLYGDSLIQLLNEASVYLQLSEWETFGCAVAEAMLCECVPVVSRYGALPEVVGECGFYVEDLFAYEQIVAQVRQAAKMQTAIGPKARQRIIKSFPFSRRSKQMLEAIANLNK